MKIKKRIETFEPAELEIAGATLLSVEEAENLLTDNDRKYTHWWWLRSPGAYRFDAATVNLAGFVSRNGFSVDLSNDSVRPALIIKNLDSSSFKIGDTFKIQDYEFKIISKNLAWLYEQDIGCCEFRKRWNAPDANNYAKSDIKKYVDEWFENEVKNNEI